MGSSITDNRDLKDIIIMMLFTGGVVLTNNGSNDETITIFGSSLLQFFDQNILVIFKINGPKNPKFLAGQCLEIEQLNSEKIVV